jgi:methylphosphotriester-DNA--protein-cysteine methyltransferase
MRERALSDIICQSVALDIGLFERELQMHYRIYFGWASQLGFRPSHRCWPSAKEESRFRHSSNVIEHVALAGKFRYRRQVGKSS